jgi:hypothetical protein
MCSSCFCDPLSLRKELAISAYQEYLKEKKGIKPCQKTVSSERLYDMMECQK